MKVYIPISLLLLVVTSYSQIRVSPNPRYLMTTDGQPFFWLGDTAWELFHRMTREEAEEYLELRRAQGFNVIQAVALAEFNGLHQPNRYGDVPLLQDDPTQLAVTPGSNPANEQEYDYWDHVDFIINRIADKGMYVGLLPTWGDKVAQLWGEGPRVFNENNAAAYGAALAQRYARYWNVIWIVGGDRPAVYKINRDGKELEIDDRPIWRAMAMGIKRELPDAFITYHPAGGSYSTSSFIHSEAWLNMNSFQSGHGSREADAWNWVSRDLALKPMKPTLDMEPCYEDHPVNPWDGKWTRARGYFTAYDVRARIYRSVFAGACGVTYGHHQVWQFLNADLYPPINVGDTVIGWRTALKAEAANQLHHLKRLMLSRPYFDRLADSTLIAADRGRDYTDIRVATRDQRGTYAFVYLPQNKPIAVDLRKLSGDQVAVTWFNPTTGRAERSAPIKSKGIVTLTPPRHGTDWVLILDDASQGYTLP